MRRRGRLDFEHVIERPGGVVDALGEALDALAAERLDGEFGPALLERLGPLLTAANRLAAEVARTVRQCELTGASEHDGKASMTAWLRGHHRLSQAEAGRGGGK